MVTYLKQSKHILSILTLCILLLFPRIYHVSLVHTFESLTANLKAIIKSKGKGRINLEDLENGKWAKWLSNAFPIILICWVVNIINGQAYLIDWKMIGNNYKYKPLLKKLEKEQGSLCSIIVLDFILFYFVIKIQIWVEDQHGSKICVHSQFYDCYWFLKGTINHQSFSLSFLIFHFTKDFLICRYGLTSHYGPNITGHNVLVFGHISMVTTEFNSFLLRFHS